MDRGLKNARPRYRNLGPHDWVERLIVGMLFAVSAMGVYVLTGALIPALAIGVLVAAVAIGVVAIL
ncbi:hypothetical protein [Nocardia sp. NPDC004722]